MDVTCARCGEPWDTYHLRHDEVHETEGGTTILYYEMDLRDYLDGKRKAKPSPHGVPMWEGNLTKYWREQFGDLGWRFGSSLYAVLECPCCRRNQPLPDADDRAGLREAMSELLEGDDDGLACELSDLARRGR